MSDDKVVSRYFSRDFYKNDRENTYKTYQSTIENFKVFLNNNFRVIDLTDDCGFFVFYISFYRLRFKKIPDFLDKECVESNVYLYLKSACIKDRLSIDILDYFILTDVYCVNNKKEDDDNDYQNYAINLDDYIVNDSADILEVLSQYE